MQLGGELEAFALLRHEELFRKRLEFVRAFGNLLFQIFVGMEQFLFVLLDLRCEVPYRGGHFRQLVAHGFGEWRRDAVHPVKHTIVQPLDGVHHVADDGAVDKQREEHGKEEGHPHSGHDDRVALRERLFGRLNARP